VFLLTAPILNSAGEVTAVLTGSIDLTAHNFLGKLSQVTIGKSGYLYLFDTDRTMIMHPDKRRILVKDVPPGANRGFDKAIAGFEGTMDTVNSRGLPVLASFKHLTSTNWILAANYPQAEAYAAIDRTRRYLGAAFFTAIVFSMVIVWYYMKHLVAPLQRFASHVRSFTGKRGAERLFANDSRDEIGVLAGAFNGMVRELDDEREALVRSDLSLRESEERFRQIADHCNEVFFLVSSDLDRMIYINPAYETLWQRSCQSLYEHPRSFTDNIHEEDRPRVLAALGRLAQGKIFDQTYRIVRSDLSVCWVHARTYPVYAENGEVYRYVGIIGDVTKQKLVEEQIRKLQQAVEQSPVSIVITDLDGDIEYVNPKFTQLTGYSHAEALGQNARILKSGETSAEIYRQLWELITAGGEWQGEFLNKKKNGEFYWESASISSIKNSAGEITSYLGVKEDISGRKRMEQELMDAREAAEESNRLKSEFLANMSHEIRTPMNGVIGMADLLKDTDLDGEQTEYVQAVKSSAEALMTVINDILDFSKIEARKLDLDPVNFTLRDCMGDIMQTLAFRASEKGLELACRVPPEVPDALLGDPGRLRQIVVNLVGNAIKFTERGEVLVSVAAETGTAEELDLHFTIADTGIGIPAEKQKKIFEPFSQADASTTRRYGGTGLGLTISAQLVEMMGGRMWVESEVGRGSAFHFTVRLGLQKGALVRRFPERLENLLNLPVLVVDDNATNRRILEEMLKNWCMNPTMADSGPSALEMLAKARQAGEPFRLLLCDVNMPDMDGFEMVKLLKQHPDLESPTIMMLTSSGERGDAARCREMGISAYLTKPVKQSYLLDAIATILGRKEPETAETPLVTRHTLRESQRSLRILLAEDNPVNQKIAVRMLEKRGHAVIVAGDGKEALAAIASQGERPFDLVLMDVQMPEMDGFEATALIREQEKSSGRHIPIIALTAHAMEGDRENCLEAGMDGYVAKPIDSEDLLAAIESVINVQAGNTRQVRGARSTEEGAFDREEALGRVDGDWDLLREVVGIFAADSPLLMAEIQGAIGEGNPIQLNRAAHALKGSVANFGARAAFEAALKLELMGIQGDMADATEFFTVLEGEIENLQSSLAAFIGGTEHEDTDRRG